RSPSIESFGSSESMHIPATSAPRSSPSSPTTEHIPHDVLRASSPVLDNDGPAAPEYAAPHRFYLKDGNLKLELDDGTFYNVHRYFFETHAPRFADECIREGRHATARLPNVSGVDFERLLAIIYPSELGKCDICTVQEWASVLRLARRWSISSLSELAIREIKPKASTIDKVALAREFDFGKAWLLPAFLDLCTRPRWIQHEEAERLGLRTVVEIGRVREEAR
ncbi:hypothetical protein HDZ31DRAFT_12221, partial [Schizophyllum fasciatum]